MIGHTNIGMRAGWFLDSVQIVVPVHGKNYMFPSHRWLDEDEADGKTEVEIYPSEILELEQCRQHSHDTSLPSLFISGVKSQNILASDDSTHFKLDIKLKLEKSFVSKCNMFVF